MKNEKEKQELQKMIDRLRSRRADFIEKKKNERRKQLADAMGETGIVPEFADADLLDLSTLTEIEISFNSSIAACLEKIRQLEKAEAQRYFETVPATIEKLTGEVERLAATLRAKEAELRGLEISLKDYTSRQNAGIDRATVYVRQADKVFDPRLAALKGGHINTIVNY